MDKRENSTFLYGRVSVLERLRANPKSIKKVLLQENIEVENIEALAKKDNIPLERIPARKLQSMKPAKDLQGVVARAEVFSYAPFDDLLDEVEKKNLSLILLDRINDPQNFGSILRTSACFGRFAVVIPKFEACPVTDSVLHVASGAENYVPIAMVANLVGAIIKLKKVNCWIVGLEAGSEATSIYDASLPFPLAVVLGSEAEGIRYGIKKHLDLKVAIPMPGTALSFNVAIASAIFSYEVARQRRKV